MSRECIPCSAGSYQPREAQDTCLVCPDGTFTAVETGATHQAQCKAQCRPGSWSRDGLETCRTCDMGHYQSEYASFECVPCERDRWTLSRGSTSYSDCLAYCPPGKTSDTGLEPCFPCPRGYFQDQQAADHCLKCPNKTSTKFPSSSSLEDCIGVDVDKIDYESLETLSVNDCFSLPCQNEGICHALKMGFQCECPPGYEGSVCENEVNPCKMEPCLNHGTCLKDGVDYKCICQNGYTGKDCEIDIDECENHKCLNNATCYDASSTEAIDYLDPISLPPYYCDCADGFQGEFCEQNIDDCQNHGCENNGQCIDGIGTFTCECSPGFSGRLCEDDIDECISNPCSDGSTCIDGINSYTCICDPGHTGEQCETSVNTCHSDPCHNGAKCVDQPLLSSFKCVCAPGFSGKLCQTRKLRKLFQNKTFELIVKIFCRRNYSQL